MSATEIINELPKLTEEERHEVFQRLSELAAESSNRDSTEPFPRGSLTKYLTAERDREQSSILKSCVQAP